MPARTRSRNAPVSETQLPNIKSEPTKHRNESVSKKRKVVKDEVKVALGNSDSKRYFLMKAEPESRLENGIDVKFSIDDLQRVGTEPWDGVRNAEASKTMRQVMKKGDLAFFYHSNTKTPGIAGIASIAQEGYPDDSAWTVGHPYFDPKSAQERPKWFRVDVTYVRHLDRFISLRELKDGGFPALQNMQLLRRPQLSVQRVSQTEWDFILSLEKTPVEDTSVKEENGPDSAHSTTGDRGSNSGMELSSKVMDDKIKSEIAESHGA